MKYYLDEDLSPKIAEILRKHGIDVVSVHEIGMVQAEDIEHLKLAASEKSCLVTRNRNDFIRLTIQFFHEHRSHSGVLIIPHTLPGDNFSHIARAIMKYDSKHARDVKSYAIDFLKS